MFIPANFPYGILWFCLIFLSTYRHYTTQGTNYLQITKTIVYWPNIGFPITTPNISNIAKTENTPGTLQTTLIYDHP